LGKPPGSFSAKKPGLSKAFLFRGLEKDKGEGKEGTNGKEPQHASTAGGVWFDPCLGGKGEISKMMGRYKFPLKEHTLLIKDRTGKPGTWPCLERG